MIEGLGTRLQCSRSGAEEPGNEASQALQTRRNTHCHAFLHNTCTQTNYKGSYKDKEQETSDQVADRQWMEVDLDRKRQVRVRISLPCLTAV